MVRFRIVGVALTIGMTMLSGCIVNDSEDSGGTWSLEDVDAARDKPVKSALPKPSSATRPVKEAVAQSTLPAPETKSMAGLAAPTAELSARPRTGLGLEQAVAMAVAFSPKLKERMARVADQEAQIDVARSGYYPTVSAGVNSSVASANNGDFSPTASISASQMIYDFGKVASSVEAAKATKDVRSAQVLVSTDSTIKETADAYVELQRSQALIIASNAKVRGLQKIGDLIKKRVEMGGSTKADEVQTQARIEAAKSEVMLYESQRGRWEASLAFLIGQQDGNVSITSGTPGWLRLACDETAPNIDIGPRVQEAQADYKRAVAETHQSQANLFPSIVLEGEAGYDIIGRQDRDTLSYDIGLAAKGALYEGGSGQARRRAAIHREAAAKTAVDVARYESRQDLVQAAGEARSLKQLQNSFSPRTRLAQETRDLYQQQYLDLGTRTLLDLINAELEIHAIAVESANTEHDLRKLGVSCIYGSGRARQAFAIGSPVSLDGAQDREGARK